jgi:cytochrome c553
MNRRAPALLRFVAAAALAACSLPCAIAAGEAAVGADDAQIASAWRILRAVDCARCHGKSYDGLAGPSIVRYAASSDRETFIRTVLEGDPPRGMPGYASNAYVAGNIDDIYRYFVARANGDITADYRPATRSEGER